MYMECPSSDTPNWVTAPELTRLSANHPCVLFAGIVNKEDVVFAHVGGGSELILKPGLNIIGGVQPFGFSGPIPIDPIPDIESIPDIDEIPDIDDIPDIESIPDIGAILDIGAMLDIGVILTMGAVEVICMPGMFDIPSMVMACLLRMLIPIMLMDEASVDIFMEPLPMEFVESSPRPTPAWRMYSGRHSIRPSPFARRLSTQCGNAPVLKYRS
jgi:hypothetical protein